MAKVNSTKSFISAQAGAYLAGSTALLYTGYLTFKNHQLITQTASRVLDSLQNGWLWKQASNQTPTDAAGFANSWDSYIPHLTSAVCIGAAVLLARPVINRIANFASLRLYAPVNPIPVERQALSDEPNAFLEPPEETSVGASDAASENSNFQMSPASWGNDPSQLVVRPPTPPSQIELQDETIDRLIHEMTTASIADNLNQQLATLPTQRKQEYIEKIFARCVWHLLSSEGFSSQERLKLERIKLGLRQIANEQALHIAFETIESREKCHHVCDMLGIEDDSIRYEGPDVYRIPLSLRQPALKKALESQNIPFQSTNPLSFLSPSSLSFNEEGFNQLRRNTKNIYDALSSVNRSFRGCFRDAVDGQWGIQITPVQTDLDRFCLQIPHGPNRLKKLYSVFAFLRELRIIDANEIFSDAAQIPTLASSDLLRINHYFEDQNSFIENIQEMMVPLDSTFEVTLGEEPMNNFYVISLGKSKEEFRLLGIEKETVLRMRAQETGSIIYPAAVQIQTDSDDVMLLFERYFSEFGMKDRKGNDKTFILETRNTGTRHKSNLSQQQFTTINSRLNRLLFIQQTAGITLEDAMKRELTEELLLLFAEKKKDALISMIENALMIDEQLKGERVLSLLELQADSYADWERKEDAWWQIFLNSCTRVSSKALSPPNSVALTDQIPRQLYRGRQPRNDSDKIETLCAILLNNQHFQEYNRRENNVLIPQLNAFKSVSLRKAGQHDFLFRMSLETLEKIVYLLENSTLSQERLDRFFLTFLRVDWEGCNEGYASKVQEMIVYLASEEGIDQLLFEKRHDLVSQFVEIRYPGSNENSMYLSGIKSALNRSLGLNFHVAGMGWGANLADEGKSFVLSNYTPTEVYSTIYTHFKNSISSAIENTFNSFEQVMAQLGVEDLERYFDSMTNEFKITAIQFDLPFLVMNYCLANHYLKWEKNIDIRPEMVAERYRQTHARQADERQQQRERELQAAMERMRAQPVYYRPASNTVYSRRGG